ncbi:MAG: molybdopterin-binding protein [Candidatus Hodarchaeales archaeon]|jgi:molybdenum cofactor synthesis domain-containing protein
MINVLLLSIGNELLNGKTINTNASFLGQKLTNKGFNVIKIVTLPDDGKMVSSEISQAIKSSEFRLILITGGLGPTWDDSTSIFLADALGVDTELNSDALTIVQERYQDLFEKKLVQSSDLNSAREKMAILPIGAIPFNNPVGTAPGIFFNYKQNLTWIFCLPGVPREMEEMYELIEPKLVNLTTAHDMDYFEEMIVTNFSDESLIAPFLAKVRQKFDVWIKSFPETYQEKRKIKLIIAKSSDSRTNSKSMVLKAKDYFLELIESSDSKI